MSDLLLKLLDPRVSEAGRITGASLAFRGGMSAGWFVLWVLAAAALIYWMYRASPVTLTSWRRHTLAGLRALFVALLLALLMRPVLAFTVEGSVRRVLVMLFDSSSSMQIKDPRLEADDQKRAAIARNILDPKGGLKQPLDRSRAREFEQVSRIEIVKSALKNERLDLLPRLDKEFDLSAFSFGQGVAELSTRKAGRETNGAAAGEAGVDAFDWVDRLEASAPTTALGDAIREALNRKRGQPLAGLVLVSDGVNNSGSQPRDAAALARQENVPLFIYGVGITSPRDIILQNLFAPEVTFVKDEVPVTVRVRGQGLNGETAEVQLKLGDQTVATKTITFSGDGEQVVQMRFTPQSTGEHELMASIDARPDETVKDNNSRSQRLKIIDAKIKVLLVDQSPRWEFRYLQAMLLRDRRIDLKVLLLEGDPAIARGTNTPYLEQFPARKEDLFKYDLVIYGDVD